MAFKDVPIQKKLIRVILITSGAVLLLTCSAFYAYEFLTFRKTIVNQLTTLGKIIAANSTAALAFESKDEADQILAALSAEPHVVAAGLYTEDGKLFSRYPGSLKVSQFPKDIKKTGFFFQQSYIVGYLPVKEGDRWLGTLYLRSDMKAISQRFTLYGGIVVLVLILSSLLAYLLTERLQRRISDPILSLAETAKAISNRQDYSVRATKLGNDELGLLTDAFNQMLTRIEEQSQEIISFNQQLEQKVNSRTIQLEAANQELEAFSYSVSHDLRAPLRAVHGYAQILEEDYNAVLDDEARRLIGVIQQNAKQMGMLIDDLLAFSRLGRKELTKNLVPMTELVESTVADIKKNAPYNAQIIIHPLHTVFADRSLLSQVFINLLSNAIKYSSATEKPVIEVRSYQENEHIIVEVKDNGAGFDNQYVHKLFGVFQRLHSSEEFEGTGVGLALVKRIITKHGGTVWAHGELNKGASFFFSLPEENKH